MHALALTVAAVLLLALVPSPVPQTAVVLAWEEVSRRPHDDSAFTQGLVLDSRGRLFESTGLEGASTLREVDPRSGAVLRSLALPDDWFGEGLALVGEELIQLTWTDGVAVRRAIEGFTFVEAYRYEGQGWGLCYDGERLVMSDGSDELTFRDPDTFEVVGSVAVTLDGASLPRLNELECVDDAVWANVWKEDIIVRIDPADGRVSGVLELDGIIEPDPADTEPGAVLNGIAWDAAAGTFLVTGKHWPELIEIRVLGPTA